MITERMSGLSSMLHTNMRGREGTHKIEATMMSRPGIGGVPVTTLPQAIQMARSVQTALDWVIKKQVCYGSLYLL